MKCPFCGHSSRVTNSRPAGEAIRRRRHCEGCHSRFTTLERVVSVDLKVVKRNNRLAEDFQMEKIIGSLGRISKGCTMTKKDVERIARAIEMSLIRKEVQVIQSAEIAKMVLDQLEKFSSLAHRRFAVNYMDKDGRLEFDLDSNLHKSHQYTLFGSSHHGELSLRRSRRSPNALEAE